MEIKRLKFKSDNNSIRNDIIYPEAYSIENNGYSFTIFPNSKYWRFGFRFSESENIDFDLNNKNRHRNIGYKDLHISVGNPINGIWNNANILELTQYHFGESSLISSRCVNYIENSPVNISFFYNQEDESLNVTYGSGQCGINKVNLPLKHYSFFKVFAWADGIDFDLEWIGEQIRINGDVSENSNKKNELRKYFLAGSSWGRDNDQIDRFIDNDVWENGYEERYSDAVNSANISDVIFLKSTFARDGVGYIRIKAIGLIKDNSHNGRELKVDWRIKDILIDIDDLSHYRRTFQQISKREADIIFKALGNKRLLDAGMLNFAINESDFNEDFNEDFNSDLNNSRTPKIASLINDNDTGEDYLEIDKDIDAFAKIMASNSFKPPLAIALFGKWGSGKSFFMNKLKERISSLSKSKTDLNYCNGISQIHFNAWSYLDANLWASLVTKIFEGLNEYISGDTEAKRQKDDIEKDLTQKLTLTKNELINLEAQRKDVKQKLSDLKTEKSKLQDELNKKINEIKEIKLVDIISEVNKIYKVGDKLEESINSNESLKTTKEQIKSIIPEKYWSNPDLAYNEVNSKFTFIKEFVKGKDIKSNVLFLVMIFLIIFFVPDITKKICDYFSLKNFTFPMYITPFLSVLIPVLLRLKKTYSKLMPIVATFWKIKSDYNLEIRNAIFNNTQREKALKLEIESKSSEIDNIDKQISQASDNILDLNFRMNNFIATEALYSFIEKRSVTDDYRKHLGIVSYIRKDFEILNQLFDEHNNETKNFRDKFERPLQRIVLYIDDLDRCPEDRVIEVLEAVNLLMAYPLFIVVVGVDPRWVKNALIKRYQLQFTGELNGSVKKEIVKIEASNYLEKIFQVPFQLKVATDENVKAMLKSLGASREEKENPVKLSEIIEISDELKIQIDNELSNVNKIDSLVMGGDTRFNTFKNPGSRDESELLKLTKEEIDFMQEFSEIIGNNPRAIKRFVNVYQIVRAHEGLSISTKNKQREYITIMFLLSLHVGPFHELVKDIEKFILKDSQFYDFNSYIEGYKNIIGSINNKRILDYYIRLQSILNKCKCGETILSLNKNECGAHLNFIKRFTFADIV